MHLATAPPTPPCAPQSNAPPRQVTPRLPLAPRTPCPTRRRAFWRLWRGCQHLRWLTRPPTHLHGRHLRRAQLLTCLVTLRLCYPPLINPTTLLHSILFRNYLSTTPSTPTHFGQLSRDGVGRLSRASHHYTEISTKPKRAT